MVWKIYRSTICGRVQSQGDHTFFLAEHDSLGIYDIVIAENENKGYEVLRQCLTRDFEIKELEKLKYLLEIKVANSKKASLFHIRSM